MPDNQESPSKLMEKPRCNGRGGDFTMAAVAKITSLQEQLTLTQQALDGAVEAKNLAYNERNQLVAALSKIFPSWLGIHDITDTEWDTEWYSIVYINAPTGQLSWHFHDDDMKYFQHLKFEGNIEWDGHSTEEKYKRLAALASIRSKIMGSCKSTECEKGACILCVAMKKDNCNICGDYHENNIPLSCETGDGE